MSSALAHAHAAVSFSSFDAHLSTNAPTAPFAPALQYLVLAQPVVRPLALAASAPVQAHSAVSLSSFVQAERNLPTAPFAPAWQYLVLAQPVVRPLAASAPVQAHSAVSLSTFDAQAARNLPATLVAPSLQYVLSA